MARIAILEGYGSPFGGHKRKGSSMKKQQMKMKKCAKRCKGGGKYQSCMSKCLRKGSR